MQEIYLTGKKIFEVLDRAQHVGLVGHSEPDGDCLGCMLALSRHFIRENRANTPFCIEGDRASWRFLPGSSRLVFDTAEWQRDPFDVLVFVDAADTVHAGLRDWIDQLSAPRPIIINIDHHHDNEHFGDINLVLPEAPATASILYDLFCVHGIHIDRKMATCLLCGILVDTHHLSNAATTEAAFAVSSDLIRRGASAKKLSRHLWRKQQVSSFPLWGSMLSRLKRHAQWDVVSTVIPQSEYTDAEQTGEGMSNFLNSIGEGKCAMILKEVEHGVLKGSFRTTRDDVDVSRLARILGGGGHRKAAGFSVEGELKQQGDEWVVE